jgi:hypothetical protein
MKDLVQSLIQGELEKSLLKDNGQKKAERRRVLGETRRDYVS